MTKKNTSPDNANPAILPIPDIDGKEPASQAGDWLAYLHSGLASDEGRGAFHQWLSRSHANAQAYVKAEQVWRDVGYQPEIYWRDDGEALLPDQVSANKSRSRLFFGLTAGFVAACAVIGAVIAQQYMSETGEPLETLRYATAVGEVSTIELSDGSEVTLSAASTIHVRYSARIRAVELVSGRAFFDVDPAPDRPFTVNAGDIDVTVLGTVFDVSKAPLKTEVAVLEGAVSVASAALQESVSPEAAARLTANQKITSIQGRLGSVEAFEAGELSWRNGRLVFLDRPLSDVVAEVNRYRTSEIVLGDIELADMRITVSLPSGNTDQLLSVLEATAPVTISQQNGKILVRTRIDP